MKIIRESFDQGFNPLHNTGCPCEGAENVGCKA